MMCLLDVADGEIRGWLMGVDSYDMRRKVDATLGTGGDWRATHIAEWFYRHDSLFLRPGRYDLPHGFLLLVD